MAKGTVNKVILLGRLGADPEVRFMPSGNAVTNISLATNDGYKDRQSGQFIDHSEWHRVSFFGKPAEIIGEYCKKGSLLYIEGRIQTRKWQDKQSGQDRYTTEIVGNEFQLIGSRSDQQNQSSNQYGSQPQTAGSTPAFAGNEPNAPQTPNLSQIDAGFNDDDIPF